MINPFQSFFKWVSKKFKADPAKMLVWTGAIGWAISSMAQIFGIASNSKISKEQKSFLIPQELYDGITNIITFLAITTVTRKFTAKLFKTGKLMPTKVKNYVKNSNIYKDKVGKHNFDIGEIEEMPANIKSEYDITKSFGTLVATTGAGILSTNIITPLVRNRKASKMQKAIIEIDKEDTKTNIERPNTTVKRPNPNFNGLHSVRPYGGSMKI